MSIRSIFFLSFLAICAILGTSIYLQYHDGIMPCPLCTLQRLAFAGAGIMFLLGALFHRQRFVVLPVSFFASLFSIAGFVFAARQTWLQVFPAPGSGECDVSLQYMMEVLPWHQVASKVFTGSAGCAEKTWELLSLSMPEWGVIFFATFFCVSTLAFISKWQGNAR